MKYISLILLSTLALLAVISCSDPSTVVFNPFTGRDSTPPTLLSIAMRTSIEAVLTFDENVIIKAEAFSVEDNKIQSVSVWDNEVVITFSKPLVFGVATPLNGRVQDFGGNSMRFTIHLWAKNEHIPSLIINEFSTKGSENHPDRVELYAQGSGNLAGVRIEGVNDSFIFGDYPVKAGQYIVVVFSKGTLQEGAFVSINQAGLATNNGYICLYTSPEWDATLIDCVIYSTMEAVTHNGFGSKAVAEKAQELFLAGHWSGALGSDAIDISKATATRSVNRSLLGDTNSAVDWYICATSNASFGSVNSTSRFD